jgi:hypothetical protein
MHKSRGKLSGVLHKGFKADKWSAEISSSVFSLFHFRFVRPMPVQTEAGAGQII